MSILKAAFSTDSTAVPWSSAPTSGGSWDQGMVWNGWGRSVTTDQAMRLSAVYACLRLLSEAVATLPLDVYRRDGDKRTETNPPGYLLFRDGLTRTDYLSQVMLSLLTDGNAYVLTPRDQLGQPVDLLVLDPSKVTVRRSRGRPAYWVDDQRLYAPSMMHIKGMCLPGALCGVSPIGYARETIGLGLAAQQFGEAFFNNGALPGAVIEAPNDMTAEAASRFRDTWNANHEGIGNAHRVGVLTHGAQLRKVSIAPDEAQFLETRQFQVPDVARIFGVPPHLIADASNSTSWGSGLAEQNLAFGQFSLRPWISRIEEAHDRLLASDGATDHFVKLNLDALLRAALKDRYEAHAIGLRSGFLHVDEVRASEDMPPRNDLTPTPGA